MAEKPTYAELEKRIQVLEQANSKYEVQVEVLNESKKLLEFLSEQTLLSIFILQDDKIVYANKSYSELAGYPLEQILRWRIEDTIPLIHPDYREFVISQGRKKMRAEHDGVVTNYQYKGINKKGEEKWVDQYSKTVQYKGKPADIISMIDITERHQAAEALRTAHNRFLTVLNSIEATVYVADMETHEILFMNKNMIETFGRDMTGEICWEVFRGEPGPCRYCTNDQLLDKSGQPSGVCSWQDKNPITGKWYINRDRAIEWTDGRLVRIQIASDITILKEMEKKIQQTQKFEAIGTLAGGIAHDFNNLLMGIQGRTSLIATDLEPFHPCFEHTKAIEEYVKSATDLTKQLLGFSRGGKYEVKATDLNELISNSASMFARTKKEIRIHTNLQNPSPVVSVDLNQIEQVLLNLYINAWQAMPGGGELYLETQLVTLDDAFCEPYQSKPGRYAKVSVTDTGIGMDANTKERIFDPFFTTKKKGRGTGLGLASAYGIIKNHDGIILARSEIGQGTTFDIFLPQSDRNADRHAPIATSLVRGSETVLLIDDEEMILDVGRAMLERLGYRVVIADGGEQAIGITKQKGNEIDLVILDLIMPGMDGRKVFSRIREIQPQIPVILSSGYSIDGQADEIMQKGCNGFLQKPFNIAELSKKVRQILDEPKNAPNHG